MLWQDWPFLFLLLPLPLLQFSSLPCSVFSSYPFVHHFLISELSISLCQVPIVSTSCLLSLFFLSVLRCSLWFFHSLSFPFPFLQFIPFKTALHFRGQRLLCLLTHLHYSPPHCSFSRSCFAQFFLHLSLVAYLGLLLWQHNLVWFQQYLSLMLYSLLDIIGAEFTTFYVPRAF